MVRPILHLPRWPRLVLILASIDALLLLSAWWSRPAGGGGETLARATALCAIALFVAFLLQCFAWIVAIAFFGRDRPQHGIIVCALLLAEIACLLGVLALSSR